jgi:hypothetical protein
MPAHLVFRAAVKKALLIHAGTFKDFVDATRKLSLGFVLSSRAKDICGWIRHGVNYEDLVSKSTASWYSFWSSKPTAAELKNKATEVAKDLSIIDQKEFQEPLELVAEIYHKAFEQQLTAEINRKRDGFFASERKREGCAHCSPLNAVSESVSSFQLAGRQSRGEEAAAGGHVGDGHARGQNA